MALSNVPSQGHASYFFSMYISMTLVVRNQYWVHKIRMVWTKEEVSGGTVQTGHLWVVLATFQIVQILVHSHFDLVSWLLALEATKQVSELVTHTDKNNLDVSCQLVKKFLDFPLWENRIAMFK